MCMYQTMEEEMDLELSMELGRMYRGDASQLPAPVPEDISSVLDPLDASFSSLEGMYDFVCNTSSLDNSKRVAFFAQFPMDHVLLLVRRHPNRLLHEAWIHDMLRTIQTALRMQTTHSHRFCERFVAGLSVVDAVRRLTGPSPPCLKQCLDLLVFTCCTCRELVRDKQLFRALANYVGLPKYRAEIMFLVDTGELYAETEFVEEIFVSLVYRVVLNHQSMETDAVEWIARMLRYNVDLRTERYVPHTSKLWRTGFPEYVGPILALLLDTSNVALVVRWDADGKLASLIHAARKFHTMEWRAVRGLLRHLVPARVRDACREAWVAPPDADRSAFTCPITLERIVNPAVLSDGHTYERDAIMRHLASSGFVSPLTRQRVAPYVFSNRAAVSGP